MNTQEMNGTPVNLNLGEKSPDQLAELHNEMCLTAVDLGLSAATVERFSTTQEGIAACERLHAQIERARERAAAPPKKERRRAAAKAKTPATTDAAAADVNQTPKPKETVVAKKAKTAKKAKKASATKVAKKAGAAKAAKSNGTRKVHAKIPDDAKITWTAADGNPARKGSIFFDRVEKVRRASGKTVDAAIKAGASRADIRYVTEVKGWAKLTGGTRAST